MSRDSEDADYYQQHKDDPDEWGDAEEPPVAKPRRGLGSTITVRLSSEEADVIRRLAKKDNLTASDVVRAAIKNYVQPHFQITVGTVYAQFQSDRTEVRGRELVELGESFAPFMGPETAVGKH